MNAASASLASVSFAWFRQRHAEARPLDRLVVKSGGTTRFVRVAEIDWIEAAGVYANLHIGGKELLYRAALNDLAERARSRSFCPHPSFCHREYRKHPFTWNRSLMANLRWF